MGKRSSFYCCIFIALVSPCSTQAAPGLNGCLYWIDNAAKTWSPEQWKQQVAYMTQAGFQHIIVCAPLWPTTQPADAPNTQFDLFMEACKGTNLRIYLSLQANPDWFVRWNLEEELSTNRAFLHAVAPRHGDHPNFAGWYIPHEVYVMWDRQAQYMTDLYSGLSAMCKGHTPDKKVVLSPFFILDRKGYLGDYRFAEPEEYEAFWHNLLRHTQIDIIALQDSGEHLGFYTMEERRPFLAAMKRACLRANKTLWINIETAELDVDNFADYEKRFGRKTHVNSPQTQPYWCVVSPAKLAAKLRLAHEFADTTITWGYYPYWDPMRGPAAKRSYDIYMSSISSRPQ